MVVVYLVKEVDGATGRLGPPGVPLVALAGMVWGIILGCFTPRTPPGSPGLPTLERSLVILNEFN